MPYGEWTGAFAFFMVHVLFYWSAIELGCHLIISHFWCSWECNNLLVM